VAREFLSVRWRPTNQKSAQASARTSTPATTIPAIAPLERERLWWEEEGEAVEEGVLSSGTFSPGCSIMSELFMEASWAASE
jgi:hypothetical protein